MIYKSCRFVGGPWDDRRVARKNLPEILSVGEPSGAYVLSGSEAGGSVHVYRWDEEALALW